MGEHKFWRGLLRGLAHRSTLFISTPVVILGSAWGGSLFTSPDASTNFQTFVWAVVLLCGAHGVWHQTRGQGAANVRRVALEKAFKMLAPSVSDIARSTTSGWTADEARAFERRVVERIQQVMVGAGVPEARVCLYVGAHSEQEEAPRARRNTQPNFDALDYACHHDGTSYPTMRFERGEEGTEGLFKTTDKRRPTSIKDRPNYDPQNDNWRSSLRVPIVLDQRTWGLLTVDSPEKNATRHKDYGNILGFGAALIAVARHCEDTPGIASDSFEELKEMATRFSGSPR